MEKCLLLYKHKTCVCIGRDRKLENIFNNFLWSISLIENQTQTSLSTWDPASVIESPGAIIEVENKYYLNVFHFRSKAKMAVTSLLVSYPGELGVQKLTCPGFVQEYPNLFLGY